ncbi:hypothetical protein CHLRE_01g000017v5 [Chlamydomonas reinhardtii]|uniref:Uncharacterized protein n=1 Tax=Chlamydomonas reinhardtii TaxID=3055 RepID=A0A2K3E4N4_CHLRE|nr:uncharacterized protein CHLRE_01g000017v5 [Chlamydomonas reinhardtii]PNW87736.1 hypothetical protein CHLRE_01g000017v5 [Chlamydomonas reinhardtii]
MILIQGGYHGVSAEDGQSCQRHPPSLPCTNVLHPLATLHYPPTSALSFARFPSQPPLSPSPSLRGPLLEPSLPSSPPPSLPSPSRQPPSLPSPSRPPPSRSCLRFCSLALPSNRRRLLFRPLLRALSASSLPTRLSSTRPKPHLLRAYPTSLRFDHRAPWPAHIHFRLLPRIPRPAHLSFCPFVPSCSSPSQPQPPSPSARSMCSPSQPSY